MERVKPFCFAPGTVEVCGCTDKGNTDVQYDTVLVYDVPPRLQATYLLYLSG